MQPNRMIFRPSLALFIALALLMPDFGARAGAAVPPKADSKAAPKTEPKTTPKSAAKTNAKTPAPSAKAGSKAAIPLPRARPVTFARATPAAGLSTSLAATRMTQSLPATESPGVSPHDLAAVKEAIQFIRQGNADGATAIERNIQDAVAAKVVEWILLRSDANSSVSFERFAGFLRANPSWPSTGLLRRRAEASLWDDQRDPGTVRAFFANQKPSSAKGRFVLARALLAQGDRKAAEPFVRDAWRRESFSRDVETAAFSAFGDLLTPADHKARMDARFYAEDVDAALRAAQRLGGNEPAIAKARAAVIRKAANTKALLDAVPAEAQRDPGYMFHRIVWLRRSDKIAEAAQVMLAVPREAAQLGDLDQWWIERRYLIRKLLDLGDAQTAFRIARDAVAPPQENYRVDQNFTAGWIALRFLNDPATALSHFARIPQSVGNNPHALARAGYWQGRALEALSRNDEARAQYEAAARHSTVYYGQIARARLGLPDLPLRAAPQLADRQAAQFEVVRAAEILYAIDERDLVASMMADLGEKISDVNALAALGEATARYTDPRGMLLLGKAALGRGLAFDYYAYPIVGLPAYTPIGPAIEQSVVYSIARQESSFNQKDVSAAMAMGLMQVTPAAGRDTAKKFHVAYDQKRLLSDQVYNVQMGAAELGALIGDYRGSYILAFAGYNAGRGRVREWIERFGDPRDPKVDPIDWVERIPFAETRNYVQRILENLQVYRVRFGGGAKLLIEADLHRGTAVD
jgi:soluble lytic murein transglycosylase